MRLRPLIALLLIATSACLPYETGSNSESGRVTVVRPTPLPIKVAPVAAHVPTQPITRAEATPLPMPVIASSTDQVSQLIAAAKTWLGTPYSWGGCTKSGVDCSCFVRNVLALVGINAPRVTTQQIQWATPISAAEAQPLDLVFFDNTCTGCGPNPTHVGLYLGGGQMIDAGDPVKIERVYSGHNARYGRPPGL